jgi:hypothetical protein
MKDFLVFGVCLAGISIMFLMFGTLIRLGYLRAAYAVRGFPVLVPRELVHGMIPLGLAVGALAVIPLIPTVEMRGDMVLYVAFPLWIVSGILAIWQPRWLKPKWLRWLEDEHSDIIEVLWEEIREEGHSWERRVRTQEDLEQWVVEVRRKHRL